MPLYGIERWEINKQNIRIMETEGICFRNVVTGLKIGDRTLNEDVRKGLLITGINAKMEILKRIVLKILENWLKLNPKCGLQYTVADER